MIKLITKANYNNSDTESFKVVEIPIKTENNVDNFFA